MAKTRETGHSSKVLAYLIEKRGVEVYVGDAAKDLQLSQDQVSSAISNLRRNYDIGKLSKGWCVYRGQKRKGHVNIGGTGKVVSLLEDNRLLMEVEGRLGVWKELEL